MANMICPKCGLFQEKAEACTSCGVIVAKLKRTPPPVPAPEMQQDIHIYDEESFIDSIKQKILYIDDRENIVFVVGRALIFLGLLVLSFKLITSSIASNYAGEIFLHIINLPFHEAGHIVFRPLGSFMTSLGGTLGQFIIPGLCFYTFLFKHLNPFAAAVCFWWIGENFLDIAPYINDARAGDLPLIGGNFGHSSPYGFHDWEYILTESGLIKHDQTIASFSYFIGSVIMIVALIWGGLLLLQQYKVASSN
jgi:hypothetical protein